MAFVPSSHRPSARALLLCLICCSAAFAEPPDFALRDGDTVVFYGDSITYQRLYTVFTETYVLTRFPRIHARFIHSGFSGDRVTGGFAGAIDERLGRDVLAYQPTVVTVMLGMNDGEYQPYDAGIFNKYASGYRHIVARLKAELPEARLTLLEPSAYDDVTRPPKFAGGYNSVLVRFGEFVRNLAKSENTGAADLNSPVVALLRAAKQAAGEQAQELIPDRVHPGGGMHMIMAEALLKSWHAPGVVTSVEIDASSRAVTKAENTTVEPAEAADEISWTQADAALPMPTNFQDQTVGLALRCSDFNNTLNREMLKVSGLVPGKYRLRIDDEAIGTFDAEVLARGINLATMTTPMSKQAKVVLDLTFRHNNLHFARWLMVQEALKDYKLAKTQATLDALDALEEEVVTLQRATAAPKTHRYQLEHF